MLAQVRQPVSSSTLRCLLLRIRCLHDQVFWVGLLPRGRRGQYASSHEAVRTWRRQNVFRGRRMILHIIIIVHQISRLSSFFWGGEEGTCITHHDAQGVVCRTPAPLDNLRSLGSLLIGGWEYCSRRYETAHLSIRLRRYDTVTTGVREATEQEVENTERGISQNVALHYVC